MLSGNSVNLPNDKSFFQLFYPGFGQKSGPFFVFVRNIQMCPIHFSKKIAKYLE